MTIQQKSILDKLEFGLLLESSESVYICNELKNYLQKPLSDMVKVDTEYVKNSCGIYIKIEINNYSYVRFLDAREISRLFDDVQYREYLLDCAITAFSHKMFYKNKGESIE